MTPSEKEDACTILMHLLIALVFLILYLVLS